ncbi:MAG TPA: hypothetical protein VN132_02105 [Bdellovibrio sp.]|nr:hypothetical protein [Bdellovibrio sp.]
MKFVVSLLTLMLAFSSLIACSSSSDSLLSSNASTASSTAVSTTPNSADLSLSVDSTSIYMDANATQVELTGNCFASTFADHVISAYRVDPANTSSLTLLTSRDINSGAIGTVRCVGGRFDLSINAGGLVSGLNNVKVVLVAIDSTGNQVNNDASASRMLNIIR